MDILPVSQEELADVIEQAPIGICLIALPACRIVAANREFAALAGVPDASSLVGACPPEYSGHVLAARLSAVWQRMSEEGEGARSLEVRLRNGAAPRIYGIRCVPFRHATGAPQAILTTVIDVTERRSAEDALRKSERRYRTLAENSGIGIWHITLDGHTIYANPAMCAMLEVDGLEELAGTTFHGFFSTASLEHMRAEHEKRPHGEASTYEAELIGKRGARRIVAVSGAPLADADGATKSLIGTFTDITGRKRAEERLAVQHQVSRVLAEASGVDDAVARILAIIGRGLCWDFGAVWMVDPEANLVRCGGAGGIWRADPQTLNRFAESSRSTEVDPGSGLLGRAWSSGEPVWMPDVSHDAGFMRQAAAAADGVRAGVAFPILLGGDVIGLLEFFSRERRECDSETLDAMASLGTAIGQFIERKRMQAVADEAYRRAHHIATRFQQALLPQGNLPIPGYVSAHAYRPALIEADVGGDFYNLFRVDEGRIGLVIGDIGGKGLDAAVIAARVQHSIVALAIHERHAPATVLDAVRRVVATFGEPDRLVTVFFGILDTETGRLHYASAGHEPPVLWRAADRQTRVLMPDGVAICGLPVKPHTAREVTLGPGDTLLLYTDGLPDARRAKDLLGLDRVRDLFAACHGDPPEAIIEAMYEAAVAHSGGRVTDDIALVVLRRETDGGH